MPRVLITGVRAPAALEWVRVFAQCGWQVWAADSLACPLGRWSRHVERYIRLPAPATDHAGWTAALVRTLDKGAVDAVLPTCEEVFWLALSAPALRDRTRVLASPLPLLLQLHHKGDFARLTANWRHQAPPTHLVQSQADLAPFAAEAHTWVFKPAFSRFACSTLVRPTTRQLRTVQPASATPWVVQRCVTGVEYCSYSLLRRGCVVAHACYQPRYRVGRGAGIGLQPVAPPAVLEFVREFGAQTGFDGQVGFDFIQQPDGRLWVLECNPRATSGVHLLADQPDALLQALLGTASGLLVPQEPRLAMVGLAMLLFGVRRHGRDVAFWRDVRQGRDVIFRRDDMAPALLQGAGFAELAWRALRTGDSLLQASTADIEWNAPCNC